MEAGGKNKGDRVVHSVTMKFDRLIGSYDKLFMDGEEILTLAKEGIDKGHGFMSDGKKSFQEALR